MLKSRFLARTPAESDLLHATREKKFKHQVCYKPRRWRFYERFSPSTSMSGLNLLQTSAKHGIHASVCSLHTWNIFNFFFFFFLIYNSGMNTHTHTHKDYYQGVEISGMLLGRPQCAKDSVCVCIGCCYRAGFQCHVVCCVSPTALSVFLFDIVFE